MEKISENIVTNFFNKTEVGDERDILIFGVQRFLEDITKIVFIIILSLFLNILKEMTVVLIVMMIYKNFVGGAHAKTNIECTIVTSIECLMPIYLTKYFLLNNFQLNILLICTIIFSIYVILRYAPADTENIPKVNKKQRLLLKIGAFVVLSIILVIFTLFIKNLYYLQIVLICLNLVNFNTTNVMYKLMRCKRSGGKI